MLYTFKLYIILFCLLKNNTWLICKALFSWKVTSRALAMESAFNKQDYLPTAAMFIELLMRFYNT